ncbi:ABC transporter substrate-binding protein [Buchananella hordeovulneris]|uniref:ABC transporter substrate-binding protein n=1 Tax=Buchananella hordeovulneris TaxID=52770 RepID=A0A1Q5PWS9_9ACTO|nr:ABC transporter substrate-binding protein [Buchananella hordeovulneris]MDO5080517.1 ABC transporter substrate-binding protein [Buchananella hordeovulneris]OKL51922.1 ABC transporter substrate-binding protein [Buchananella hordeovulneris]RRD44605.1 ABC transporter substrate-binding protein [Buchananella hordeovulneris]RRD51807.1 ABC transporter substrate-binding protein [Buchananella hordeovulneris]
MRLAKHRVSGLIAVSAAVALSLSACGGKTETTDKATASGEQTTQTEAAPEGGAGGEIVAGVAYETTNYHPSTTSSALAMGTNWHVVEGLYQLNMKDYSVYKALAAEDEPKKISDTEYEITLRDGAKFSDGTDVTTADVVKSFERSMAEGNLYASMLSFVDKVEAKDDKTVSIKLKEPFAAFKSRLTIVKIVPAAASDDDLTKLPIGTGPWMYESINESEIVAVPNPHYNGELKAGADKMRWSVLKDDNARTTAAETGVIDVMEAIPADAISAVESAGMTVDKVPSQNMPFLLFNTTKAPFNDARVRQAIHYAINTDKLVTDNMSGEAIAANSFLATNHPMHKEAKTVFKHDQEKAKALLAEAGVSDLSITLLSTDHPWVEGLTPQIKNDLEAIGIKVTLKAEASSSLYENNLDVEQPTFDVALAPGDPSVFGNDPGLIVGWWLGDNSWTKKRSFWQTGDPENFAKLQTMMAEANKLEGDAAKAKWGEVQDFVAEQAVIYPLFHRVLATGYNGDKLANVGGIGTTGLYLLGAATK